MGYKKPKQFTKKPVDVEAIQYTCWSDALDILAWGAPVFYVPQGYEHHLRGSSDHDGSNGHILEHAPAYLLLWVNNEWKKVARNSWIIKNADGTFEWMPDKLFDNTFNAKEKPVREFPLGA